MPILSLSSEGHSLLSAKTMKTDNHIFFVKENCCDDGPGGIPQEFMDEEDSSLTR